MRRRINTRVAEDLRRLGPGVELKIVPIVIGNTGPVSTNAKEYIEKLEIEMPLSALQKTAVMQTIQLKNMHKQIASAVAPGTKRYTDAREEADRGQYRKQ